MNKMSDAYLRALELRYSLLVQPKKLIEYMSTPEEFIEWAKLGTQSDLRSALIAFEKDELYDHCIILKQVLESKKLNE